MKKIDKPGVWESMNMLEQVLLTIAVFTMLYVTGMLIFTIRSA